MGGSLLFCAGWARCRCGVMWWLWRQRRAPGVVLVRALVPCVYKPPKATPCHLLLGTLTAFASTCFAGAAVRVAHLYLNDTRVRLACESRDGWRRLRAHVREIACAWLRAGRVRVEGLRSHAQQGRPVVRRCASTNLSWLHVRRASKATSSALGWFVRGAWHGDALRCWCFGGGRKGAADCEA
jgi:hypothetical protein